MIRRRYDRGSRGGEKVVMKGIKEGERDEGREWLARMKRREDTRRESDGRGERKIRRKGRYSGR